METTLKCGMFSALKCLLDRFGLQLSSIKLFLAAIFSDAIVPFFGCFAHVIKSFSNGYSGDYFDTIEPGVFVRAERN